MSNYSVKKPMTVFVGVILVILLGFVSYTKMSTDLLPAMDLPYVMVMTTSVGDSPEKIEKNVTKPLEQQLSTTSGVKEIQSISSENVSVVIMEFYESTDMNAAMINISAKIDLANLEEGTPNPTILQINPDMMPIMIGAIDMEGVDLKEASKRSKESIIPALERVDGVASITPSGMVEERISLSLNQDKIDQLNQDILKEVDTQMASAKAKLDDGAKQLADAKRKLRIEEQKQLSQLIEGDIQLNSTKSILNLGVSGMDSAEEGLQLTMSQIQEELNKAQANGLDVSELLDALQQASDSYEQLKANHDNMNQTLITLNAQSLELGKGKQLFAETMANTYAQIEAAEKEILKGTISFERASESAYQAVGFSGMLTKQSLNQILTAQNLSMPAGYIDVDHVATLVKVGDEFKDMDELKQLALIEQGDWHITLSDIADIQMVDNANENFAKINGNDGLLFNIQKQSTASTSKVSKACREQIQTLQEANKDLHITILSDQGSMIEMVIDSVLNNLISGGILAAFILFFFLKDIKTTVITAFSIPISLMFALVLMYFSGVTLNIISLAGLALGVGMLVDNSIVVVENIYRLRNEGKTMKEAAIQGASQMAGAIFASTLTTICVFLPIVFTEGIAKQLFTDMGYTIAYSLLASLIVALTLVPAMSAKMLQEEKKQKHGWFDQLIVAYERALAWCLKKKAVVFTFVIALFIGSCYLITQMGTAFIPTMDSETISVQVNGEKELTQDEFRKKVTESLPLVEGIEGVKTVGVMEGGMGMMSMASSQGNQMNMYLILEEQRSMTSQEIASAINQLKTDEMIHLQASGSDMDMSALMGSGVQLEIKGQDLTRLQEISNEIKKRIELLEGISSVSNGLEDNDQELVLHVNKNEAMKYQLTVAQVYAEVASLLQTSTNSTSITYENGNEYPIIIKNGNDNLTLEDIKSHEVKTQNDTSVPLSKLITINTQDSMKSINHKDQARTIRVTANIQESANIGKVGNDIEAAIDDYELPEGYHIEFAGENETINSTMEDLVKMIALAIVFIYLIMVAQFQSLRSPFIVLFTLPLAFTGGLLALWISGCDLSIIAMLGFLILSGVVVNNGIVFVDCVNQFKEEGMMQKQALLMSGKIRIRPIIMTALTTILGLSTMALGIGSGADMLAPMAIVTIGGLFYATFMTLFVVPCIYDLINSDKLKQSESKHEA